MSSFVHAYGDPEEARQRRIADFHRAPVTFVDPKLETRGYAALDIMEQRLTRANHLAGDALSLADIALVAYTRMAHEGGFELARYRAIRQWIANVEAELGLAPAR